MKKVIMFLVLSRMLISFTQELSAQTFWIDSLEYTVISTPPYNRVALIDADNNIHVADIPPSFVYNDTTYRVARIGRRAFEGCNSLILVILPNGLTDIMAGAFSNCSSLTSISIPNSVTTIEDRCEDGYGGIFEGCSSLTSVIIPNSVTSIGRRAFYGCSSLTSVILPNNLTSIKTGAFRGCI